MSKLSKIEKQLLKLYQPGNERVGFILKNGVIVEVDNTAEDPTVAFNVKGEDIQAHGDEAIATWHTHPDRDYNLSGEDYETFLQWPNLDHYIIGNNGVRKYVVEFNEVLIA